MASVYFASASELITLTNTFLVGSTPTDPTTITLNITDPTGATTSYTYAASQITKTSAGVYTKDITCSTAGTWTYEWVGTGTVVDTVAGTWEVLEVELGRLYATVEDMKSRLGVTGTNVDYELHQAVFAASRYLEQYCQRTFWRTPTGTARTFIAPPDARFLRLPEFCDLAAIESLQTDLLADGNFSTTWASSDYQLLPLNSSAAPEQQPYTVVRSRGFKTFPLPTVYYPDRIKITGTWGWPVVPFAIRQSALILASELFKLRDAPGGGIAGMADFGVVTIRDNPMIAKYANPYRRSSATLMIS